MSNANSSVARISVNCSYCERTIEADPSLSGSTVTCSCGATVSVPFSDRARPTPDTVPTRSRRRLAAPFVGIAVVTLIAISILYFGSSGKKRLESNHASESKPAPAITSVAASNKTLQFDDFGIFLDFKLTPQDLARLFPSSLSNGWETMSYQGRTVKYELWQTKLVIPSSNLSALLNYKFFPDGPLFGVELLGELGPGDDFKGVPLKQFINERYPKGTGTDGVRVKEWWDWTAMRPREPKVRTVQLDFNGLQLQSVRQFVDSKRSENSYALALIEEDRWITDGLSRSRDAMRRSLTGMP